jgi:hypothetical protein
VTPSLSAVVGGEMAVIAPMDWTWTSPVDKALPFRDVRSLAELSVEFGLPAPTVMDGRAVLELPDLARRGSGDWWRIRQAHQVRSDLNCG